MIVFDQLRKNDPPLRLLTLVVLAGLLVLIAGLWWVQIIRFHDYKDSERSQSYRTVRIPAVRGKIMDRNGLMLAENRPSHDINLYVEELSDGFKAEFSRLIKEARGPEGTNRIANKLRSELSHAAQFNVAKRVVDQVATNLDMPIEFDPKEFKRHYAQMRALPMPVLENLQPDQLARFLESPSMPPSVDLEVQPLRYYPNGRTAAHLLGYLGKDFTSQEGELASYSYRLTDYKGKIGLEKNFDSELRGKAGVKSVLVNHLGYRQTESVWFPAEAGKNLVLTLDLPLQLAAEKALFDQLGTNARAAIVVMDANNGDVFALVSSPSYDPNQFIPAISQSEMDVLNDPETYPMVNRVTQGAYHPGSVFKIMTALACLESGTLNETNLTTPLYNPGEIKVGRTTIGDEAAPGDYDFERAFIKSSNTYFIHYAIKAGFPALQRAGMAFQFGHAMSLPTQQNVDGLFPDPEYIAERRRQGLYWTEGDTANLSIGQGLIDVTPMQIAVAIAAVANGGKIVQPRVVDRIVPQPGSSYDNEVRRFPNEVRGFLNMKPEHLALLRDVMRKDVANYLPGPNQGTGFRAEVPGMDICAKTGTAENKPRTGGRVLRKDVWFASFAPKDDPKYVVVVMVEGGVFGGVTAAPIAKKIYQAIQQREQALMGRNLAGR